MQENETGLLSNSIHKSKLEMGQDLNICHKTIKLLQENTGKNLLNISMSNFFLDTSPQARETKQKINWD